MAKTPKEGDTYRLLGPSPLGVGPGMVLPDQEVTVTAVDKDGDLAGAGVEGEPTVIFEWDEKVPGFDPEDTAPVEERKVVMVTARRASSMALDTFNERFEEVS